MIGLALLLSACSAATSAQPQEQLVAVTAAKAETMTLENRVEFSGRVAPENSTAVFSKLPGKVEYAPLAVGDAVEAGQVLFRLETTDLELQLDTVSAALSVAEAAYAAGSVQQAGSVPLAASQLELARKAVEDLTALYETGAATKTQLDEAQLKLEGAQLQYDTAVAANTDSVAAAQLEQAKAAYNAAVTQLGYATVYAPVSGTVTYYLPKVYAMLSNTAPAVVITTGEGCKVAFSVSPSYAGRFAVGDTVTVDGVQFATLTLAGELPDSATGLIPMEAVTDGTVSRKAGQVVAVSAVTERAQDAIALPLDAVRTDASGDYVYLSVSGVAKKVYITPGIVTAQYVQALAGVAAGDMVVTSWSSLLIDGAALTIVE